MVTVSSTADSRSSVGRLQSRVAQLSTRFPDAKDVVVAYSGGRDSHTLLAVVSACLRDTPLALSALHINHRLQPDADAWANHCERQCEALKLPCEVQVVTVQEGKGPEAAARDARYAAYAGRLRTGTVLLQAHHADDQVETVLLRLLRGCGVHGARGMPATRALAQGHVWRPFMDVPADVIAEAADALALNWIDDPSNTDLQIDRNYLRHEVLPLIRRRWPAVARAVGTSTANFADEAALLDQYADAVLTTSPGNEIAVSTVTNRPRPEARVLLHRWINRAGLVVPSRAALDRIIDEVALAAVDAQPVLRVAGRQIRRHRGRLFIVREPRAFDTTAVLEWRDTSVPLALPTGEHLHAETLLDAGLDERFLSARWSVRFRCGSALLKPAGKSRARVKKLLNAAGIPPWERPALPHLYIDGDLAWVQGLGVDDQFAAANDRSRRE